MRASVESTGGALDKASVALDQVASSAANAENVTRGFANSTLPDVAASVDLVSSHVQESWVPAFDAALNATEGSLKGLIRFGDTVAEVRGKSEVAAGGIARVGEEVIQIGGAAEEAGGSLTTASGEIIKIGSAGKEAADGLGEGAAAAGEIALQASHAAEGAKNAAEGLTDAAAAARDAAPAVQDAATGIAATGTAAKESAEPLGKIAEHLKEVKDADPAKVLGDTADQAGRAASASKDLATGLGNVVKAVTEGQDELKLLGTRGGEIAEEWHKADTALSGFNERAGIAIGLCRDLQECLAGLAAS
jgi:hypothetical protein